MREGATQDLVAAPLVRRVVAAAIDFVVVIMIQLGIAGTLGASEDRQQAVLLSLIVMSVYHIVSLAAKSATPGKTAMGISVTDLDGNALQPDKAISDEHVA